MPTLWIQIFGISQEIGTKGVWWSLVLGGKMLSEAFCYRYWILCIYFSIKRSNIWQVGKKRQKLWLCPGALEHRVLSFKYLKHLIMYPFCSETKIYFLKLILQQVLTTLSTTFLCGFAEILQLKWLNYSCINWKFSVVRIIYLNTAFCLYWDEIQGILWWQWSKISRCGYHDNYTPECVEAHGCIWSIVISPGVRLFHDSHTALMAHCLSSIHDPYSESCLYWTDWISPPPQLSLL